MIPTAARPSTFLIADISGYTGYLTGVELRANSDGFVFDTEIIAQGIARGFTIREIPIETRYFDEASQIGFWPSVRYGLSILKTMAFYKLHAWGIWSASLFKPPPVSS